MCVHIWNSRVNCWQVFCWKSFPSQNCFRLWLNSTPGNTKEVDIFEKIKYKTQIQIQTQIQTLTLIELNTTKYKASWHVQENQNKVNICWHQWIWNFPLIFKCTYFLTQHIIWGANEAIWGENSISLLGPVVQVEGRSSGRHLQHFLLITMVHRCAETYVPKIVSEIKYILSGTWGPSRYFGVLAGTLGYL